MNDVDTIEERFRLIEQVYQRMGTNILDHRGNCEKAASAIRRGIFRRKSNRPIQKRIGYSLINQGERPKFVPANMIADGELEALKRDLAYAIGEAQTGTKLTVGQHRPYMDQVVAPMKALMQAAATGDLSDWFRFFEAFDKAGLSAALQPGKSSNLSFWSGDTAKKAAGVFSKTNVGSRDLDQVSFDATLKTSAPFEGARKHGDSEEKKKFGAQVWYELLGLQSSLYATSARGDIIAFLPKGISVGNIFWNNELPILRKLQTMGHVDNILVYTAEHPPADAEDDSLTAEERKALWYEQCVALTSPGVKMSKRNLDGSWTKLGVEADFFVKWLLKNRSNKREFLVLYAYRLETGIWAKMLGAVTPSSWYIELSRPGQKYETPRFIEVVGYTNEDAVLKCMGSIEKYLMANHRELGSLPSPPDSLVYANDAFFLRDGARLYLQALRKKDRTWLYEPVLRRQLGENAAMLDSVPNESDTEVVDRVGKIRAAL